MSEIEVDRVQLIAAAMHMHARIRPWNNVRPGYRLALVMYLCNDIYVHISGTRLAIRTHVRTHGTKHYISALSSSTREFTLGAFSSAKKAYNYVAEHSEYHRITRLFP